MSNVVGITKPMTPNEVREYAGAMVNVLPKYMYKEDLEAILDLLRDGLRGIPDIGGGR